MSKKNPEFESVNTRKSDVLEQISSLKCIIADLSEKVRLIKKQINDLEVQNQESREIKKSLLGDIKANLTQIEEFNNVLNSLKFEYFWNTGSLFEFEKTQNKKELDEKILLCRKNVEFSKDEFNKLTKLERSTSDRIKELRELLNDAKNSILKKTRLKSKLNKLVSKLDSELNNILSEKQICFMSRLSNNRHCVDVAFFTYNSKNQLVSRKIISHVRKIVSEKGKQSVLWYKTDSKGNMRKRSFEKAKELENLFNNYNNVTTSN